METDIFIIEEVIKGETHKYAVLVQKYSEKIYALAKSMLKNKEDAEEITQNVFLKAFHALGSFRGDARFSSFLYRICYNECVNCLKSRKIMVDLGEFNLEEAEINQGFYELKRTDQKKFLEQALSMIHPEYSLVLTLFYLEEQSVKEIVEMTGLSLSAAKVKLHNARNAMATAMNSILKNEIKNLY